MRQQAKGKDRFMVRQGDVLVLGVDRALPEDHALTAIPPEGGRTILAHGEVTGHAHALPATEAQLFGPSDDLKRLLGIDDAEPGDRVLVTMQDTQLTHEEHGTIAIPAGTFVVRRQREWTDADEPRQVAD